MTTPTTLPVTPEEVTPEWLTGALRAGGALGAGGAVASVSSRVIGEGVGFIGTVARLTVEYTGDAAGAPRTIIAKFPSPDPGSRAVGNLYGLYEREVRFYNHLAADSGLHTPRCFFAEYDPAAGQSVVLLEELSGGDFGDQVGGCTLDEAKLAIEAIAAFHGSWWQRPELEALPWMTKGEDLVRGAMLQAYEMSWPVCVERAGHLFPGDVRDALPTLHQRILGLLDAFAEKPLTVLHGDYRLDNMFFAPGTERPLVVCDWQSPNRGWASYDLAYFISGSLEPEARRAHEMPLIEAYHRELTRRGVTGYPLEELVQDYRLSLAIMLGIFVVNGASLPQVNERAVQAMDAMIGRFVQAFTDHNVLSLLP